MMLTRSFNLLAIIVFSAVCPQAEADPPEDESIADKQSCVLLLHGLARSARSMKKLAKHLESEGYQAINLDYPSRAETIQELARKTISNGLTQCTDGYTVNFVTHSLGGILVRQYLSKQQIPSLGRVVMLGPPNKGSQVVDRLKDVSGFGFVNGLAGGQLGTGEDSIPNQLGAANFEVGIIAGTRTINPILSLMLPNPDDGKVSVANTKLEGMSDHLTLPVSHPFLMKNKHAIRQVTYFLDHGRFDRDEEKKNK
ncbi:MAG: alpha/beta hydrolase [Pseudomonadota bacterium]